jgi:hypothetical protein
MSKSTIEHLPKEIMEAIPEWESIPAVKQIVEEALIGEFHDYKNTKYDCGKIEVVSLMTACKDQRLLPMIEGVMNGDYDEHADETDIANMKKDWIAGGGSEESWNKNFGGK